MTKVIIHK